MESTTIDSTAVIVEWAPFRTKPGINERTVLEHSARLQEEFLRHQPGFLRRELLQGPDGQWVDLVWWADEESANAIIPAIAGSSVCQSYFHLMIGTDTADPAGGVTHFRRIRAYG